jgi:hypothetical protein
MVSLPRAPGVIDISILLEIDPSVWKFAQDSSLFGGLAKELLNGEFVAHGDTIE